MSKYVIIGAGAVGSLVAEQLSAGGHQESLVSRSGSGPARPGVSQVAADASDATAISALASGCDAIFNCANPAYHRWLTDWPPIANALLAAAERSGAVLVTLSNLYAYGEVTGPISPTMPLSSTLPKAQVRARMWTDALAAHQAGRIRATEVRASDFVGPRAQSHLGDRVVPRLAEHKGCQVLGSADQPHSWTYVGDVATTLIACAQNPAAWGRAWHVPTNTARTQRQAIDDLADAMGVAHVKVSTVPSVALKVMGLFNPLMRELPKTMYQFTAPFVIDDTATRTELGLEPTPWPEVLRATAAFYATA
jgi:nucleoside-diphosphate-sugar epimerase